MKLIQMIRLYMAVQDITQKDLANEIGISESSLSRFMSGDSMPDALGFMKIITWACS